MTINTSRQNCTCRVSQKGKKQHIQRQMRTNTVRGEQHAHKQVNNLNPQYCFQSLLKHFVLNGQCGVLQYIVIFSHIVHCQEFKSSTGMLGTSEKNQLWPPLSHLKGDIDPSQLMTWEVCKPPLKKPAVKIIENCESSGKQFFKTFLGAILILFKMVVKLLTVIQRPNWFPSALCIDKLPTNFRVENKMQTNTSLGYCNSRNCIKVSLMQMHIQSMTLKLKQSQKSVSV